VQQQQPQAYRQHPPLQQPSRRTQFQIPVASENVVVLDSVMQRELAERRERDFIERQQRARQQEAERRHLELEEQKRHEAQRFANMKVTKVMKRPSAVLAVVPNKVIDDLSDTSGERSQPSISERSASDKSVSAMVSPMPSPPVERQIDNVTTQKEQLQQPEDSDTTPAPPATHHLTPDEIEKRKKEKATQQQLLILQHVQAARAAKPQPKPNSKAPPPSKPTMPTEDEENKMQRLEDRKKREPRTKGVLFQRQHNGFLLRITRDGQPEKRKVEEPEHDDEDVDDVESISVSSGEEEEEEEEDVQPPAPKPFIPAPIPKISAWELGLPSSVVAAKSTTEEQTTQEPVLTETSEIEIELSFPQNEDLLESRDDRHHHRKSSKLGGGQRKNGKEHGKFKGAQSKAKVAPSHSNHNHNNSNKTRGNLKEAESKPSKDQRQGGADRQSTTVKKSVKVEEELDDVAGHKVETRDNSRHTNKSERRLQKPEGRSSSGGRGRGSSSRSMQSGRGRDGGGRGSGSGRFNSRNGEKSKFDCMREFGESKRQPRSKHQNEEYNKNAKNEKKSSSSVHNNNHNNARSRPTKGDKSKPTHGSRKPRKQQIAAAAED